MQAKQLKEMFEEFFYQAEKKEEIPVKDSSQIIDLKDLKDIKDLGELTIDQILTQGLDGSEETFDDKG